MCGVMDEQLQTSHIVMSVGCSPIRS